MSISGSALNRVSPEGAPAAWVNGSGGAVVVCYGPLPASVQATVTHADGGTVIMLAAHLIDTPSHQTALAWARGCLAAPEPFAALLAD